MSFKYDVYRCLVFGPGVGIFLLRFGFVLSCMLTTLSVSLVTLSCFYVLLWLTTEYVRLVGQEPAPSKCFLLSTSREVRKDMNGWVLSLEGDQWSVKFDVRDLGGHLDIFNSCC